MKPGKDGEQETAKPKKAKAHINYPYRHREFARWPDDLHLA
jgi:hypothetical protein